MTDSMTPPTQPLDEPAVEAAEKIFHYWHRELLHTFTESNEVARVITDAHAEQRRQLKQAANDFATEGIKNVELSARLAAEQAVREKLVEALPDSDKLELLANWLDKDDIAKHRVGHNEVQTELRVWAKKSRAALAAEKLEKHDVENN